MLTIGDGGSTHVRRRSNAALAPASTLTSHSPRPAQRSYSTSTSYVSANVAEHRMLESTRATAKPKPKPKPDSGGIFGHIRRGVTELQDTARRVGAKLDLDTAKPKPKPDSDGIFGHVRQGATELQATAKRVGAKLELDRVGSGNSRHPVKHQGSKRKLADFASANLAEHRMRTIIPGTKEYQREARREYRQDRKDFVNLRSSSQSYTSFRSADRLSEAGAKLHVSQARLDYARTARKLEAAKVIPSNLSGGEISQALQRHNQARANYYRAQGLDSFGRPIASEKPKPEESHGWRSTSLALFQGAAIGTSIVGRQLPLLHPSSTSCSPSSFPLPATAAKRNSLLQRVGEPSRSNLEVQKSKGRIMDFAWTEHYEKRKGIQKVVSQPTWRDPNTGRAMSFLNASYRRPDLKIVTDTGDVISQETKATPRAAKSVLARKQINRDLTAQQSGAVLGKGKGTYHKVDHVIIRNSLPILGPGGNTALPPEVQKHVMIEPRVPGAATGGSGIARRVVRGASRAATPVAAVVDASHLIRTYQKDGFGSEFRSQAAGVAGGWAGAAAGAQLGATVGSFIPIPGVGTAAGALVGGGIGYLVGSSAASKLEEGIEDKVEDIKDKAEDIKDTVVSWFT
jgi:uncharacterized protein (DUF697 family)